MGRLPEAANRARACEECGWTTFPRPEPNPDGFTVTWVVPETCSRCGAPVLEPEPPFQRIDRQAMLQQGASGARIPEGVPAYPLPPDAAR